jgi:hypothetical protein
MAAEVHPRLHQSDASDVGGGDARRKSTEMAIK